MGFDTSGLTTAKSQNSSFFQVRCRIVRPHRRRPIRYPMLFIMRPTQSRACAFVHIAPICGRCALLDNVFIRVPVHCVGEVTVNTPDRSREGATVNLQNAVFVVSAVLGLTATMTAQQAIPKRATSKTHATSVTLTGCVAQGIDADHYLLANAVRREQPPSSTAKAGSSATVGADKASASDRTGPYDLQGGEFKAHLGHQVEVTGTSGSSGKIGDASITNERATESKPLPRFNVLSVKMLSDTCA